MAALDPGFEAPTAGAAVGSWLPARYTPTLTGTEEFRTQGDRLLVFASKHLRVVESARLVLDEWQRWLVRHVLEVYPDDWPVERLRGQLRYRQVVISMGRQNGKSLLGTLFCLFFLCLHVRGPRVIGLASRDSQAKIIYNRVKYAIDNDPDLSREIRTTSTRGIIPRGAEDGYFTLPAKEESAQGEPGSAGLYDELHLGLMALWDALILSMRSKRNALLIGFTTAGDDASDLLKRLYREGAEAIAGNDERFGFFCWEAPDDELTEAGVIAANPAVACGRVPLDEVMHEARKGWANVERGPDGLTGRQRVIRYTLNRFIAGAGGAWASTAAWLQGKTSDLEHPVDAEVIYALERTTEWEAVSITATSKRGAGYLTELVATINAPSTDTLERACALLATRPGERAVFALSRRWMNGLAGKLREAGHTVVVLGDDETQSAAHTAKGLIARQAVEHPEDKLLTLQMSRGRRRDTGDTWRLSRTLSLGDVDAVLATCYGLHVADTRSEAGLQLF